MHLLNNTLTREVTEIVKALPAKKLSYSAFAWSAPFTVGASLLTTSYNQLNQSEFVRWILILCLSHLSMLPFIVYGQEARAIKIQFPLLGLMAVTRGFVIAILEPLFKIDPLLPLYLEILNSAIVLFYCFSIFAIVNFFRVTVRTDIKNVIEESMLQETDLTQFKFTGSENVLIEKIAEIQKKIAATAESVVTRQTLQEQAREIDLLIREQIRPLSHSEWRKGELVHVPGGFRSVFKAALAKRLIPVLGVSFFAIPFYLKYSTLASGFLHAAYIVFTFNFLVGVAWWWSNRSPQFVGGSIFLKNCAFFAFLFFFVFPANIALVGISPFVDAPLQDSIRQNFLLYFFLTLFCLLSVLALQLMQEGKSAIELIRSQLSGQRVSMTSRDYAQYLHAEVQSQLLGCKLLLLKSAEEEVPQFTPEMLRLINEKLKVLMEPNFPNSKMAPSERIADFFASWSGIVRIESAISPEIDQVNESGNHAAQIIEESVVNAIRHGKATEIYVQLDIVVDQISINILNNGSLLESKSASGLGSLLFNTFASEWSIGIEGSTVKSHFKVPLPTT